MRKNLIPLVLTAIFLLLLAGSASAEHACVADDGSGDAYYCGDVVLKSCTFNGSMTCADTTNPGLEIGADNIVIDGDGYRITGNENATACGCAGETTPEDGICGVIIQGQYNNVTVKNLEIENFCTGVAIKGQNKLNTATNITIHKCIIHDNGNTTCEWEASTHGIHMVWVSYSDITNNKIYNNTGTGSSCCAGGDGIFLYEGKYINITCNEIYDNRKGGIFIKMKPMYNKIFHNKLWENGGPGAGTTGGIILRCKKTNFNTIAYNNASNNYGDGIYIGGRNNTIRNNIANDNGYAGINMGRSDGSYNNELYDNTVCGNGFYDISVYGPGSGTIGDNNTCTTASDYCDEGTTGCTYDCLPDLTIVDKEEDWVVAGSTYTITYTIKNAGNKEAGASTTSIRIDGTEEATDSVPELTAGASHTSTLGPFAMSGTSDTIMVRADINNTVSETNESNNCLENKLELPGLLIDKKSEEWVDLASMKYNITYTVKNIGDAPANASTTCIKIDGTEVTNDAVPELASGASHTKELGTFTMSGDSDTIEVCADKDNAIAESNETNNCLKNVFEYLADLNITDKFEEWVDLSNKTYNITYTVKNIGDREANTTNISIFIDDTIKKNVSVPGLNATESNTSTIGPFEMTGKNDTIKVCADINGNVSESDETNNCMENVFEYPGMSDLNITVKSEEWVDLSNKTYNITYTVKNIGDREANTTNISIFIDGTIKKNVSVPGLNATESNTSTIGPFNLSGKNDTIKVCADINGNVSESDETNNCLENVFEYLSMPDLNITVKSEEWVDLANMKYNVTYTVKNVGDAPANASTICIKIDGTEVTNDTVPELASCASHTKELGTFTMSGDSDTIEVCADKDNAIAERNEDNNCLQNTFVYPSVPDLAIVKKLEVWVASNVTYNTYNITYTVKNVGKGDANESTTSILIDRVEVANDSVGALEEGESYTNTLGPFTMSGENDTVRICADKNNDVAESNEDNNCLENVFEYSWIGCVTEDGTLFRCGNTVTKNCTFNGSMSCPFTDGLKIGANNVTIEGNNSMLDGVECTLDATRSGIYNPGYDDVAIKDLEVKSFCFGIRLRGTSNRIENNTIENCKIHHNGNATSLVATHGIKMEYVFNSTIRNNSIHHQIAHVDPNPGCEDGGNGMFLYKGDYNLITQNEFYDNTKGGLFMKYKPMHNNISYNELWGNGQGGIILRCKLCDYNLIEHNNASNNYGSGIFIGGNNNTIRYNMVCNNKDAGPYYEDFLGGHGYGINIGRSDGSCFNVLTSNKVCGNDYKDIYVVSGVIGNHGVENTCNTTYNYIDEGTTGCTYDCSPAPDLVIVNKKEERVNLMDKTYNITYTVKNIGDADAGTSNTSIGIDGAEVATDSVPVLASGASHTNEIGPFTMSGGSDTIRVSADRDNVVLEKSREYNNYLENIFRHPEMPDLVIIAKSEAWIVEGSNYNITYTIKNSGKAIAGESNTSIKIDGTEVATDSVKALNASESCTSTLGPFTMSGNSDTILICADCENNIIENNEENNCKENVFEYSGGGGDGDSTCSDGTLYGACSVNKPKYCDNGILIDDCVRCGCPEGETCDETSGSCYVQGEGACIAGDGTAFFCGDTVTKSCTLNGSMGCPPGHGLIIGAEGITIDGNGYEITGVKTAEACAGSVETGPGGGAEFDVYCGILNRGYDYVTITNLEIENFCTGIGLFGSGANIVENNKITDCIIHDNGLSTPFEGMDMVTHGIHASYARHLEIIENDIYNNEGTGDFCGAGGNGIFIYAGVSENYCDISHNKLHGNAKSGFWTKMKLSQSTISHNEVYGNGNGEGIADDVRGGIVLRCKLSNENLIAYNDVHDHDADGYGYGIYVGGGSNTIEHNTVTGNSRHGISMARSDGSFNNELYNNLVCDNGVDICVTSGVTGNHGDENICDTTNYYDDDGTTGCTNSCPTSPEEESDRMDESEEERIEESKEISFIEAGANASISFNETDIVSITIYVKNDVANFSVNVQQFDVSPANITNLTGVSYHSYMNITASNITDVDLINATIRFGVNSSWVVDESIDVDTIRLNRYSDTDGNWTVLPITKINETENNASIYFEAITPGFSLFLITGEQKMGMVVAETTPAPTSTQIADGKINGASIWIHEMPAETSTPVEVQTEVSGSNILIILIASLSVILIASVIFWRRKR